MRRFLLGATGIALLACASTRAADAQLVTGVYAGDGQAILQPVQFNVLGGRNYCWYDGGWHGPGWYWCGFRWNRGFGWGGAWGWNGWGGPRGFEGHRDGFVGRGEFRGDRHEVGFRGGDHNGGHGAALGGGHGAAVGGGHGGAHAGGGHGNGHGGGHAGGHGGGGHHR
jgi:hypothetical protein